MAGESMKTYQVEYLITMKDNASGVLTTLAENATKLKEPLEQVKGYIREVEGTLRTLKENVNTALVIKPELNTAAIKEQLKGLETDANKIASNIARAMSAALSGVAPKSSVKKPTTKTEIKKEIAEAERLKATTRGAAAKALGQEVGALKRKLASASNKTVSSDKVIQSYSTLAKETTKLSAAADAIKKINTNVSAMGSLKDRSIKIDADISPAVAKINALLETIRTNVAALPITVTEAGKAAAAGTKGGKAISSKTGKTTKIGAANVKAASKGSLNTVQNVLRAKENVTQLATRLDGSTLVTQLIQSIEKLQTEAKAKPVVIRSVFNGGDAGFQLNRTIASLQELANGKPIVLKSALATGASPANTGAGKESAQTATGKGGKGAVQTGSERNAALYNTRQLERLAASKYPVLPVMPGGGSSSGGAGGYGGAPMRMAKPSGGMYAKTKALIYNITGNTSFGARTPMAIEMAKGMGTMFAIGGAMSAIGSSLSQSVNYQNIMKTAQSILENGTNNYSDGGFKEMEQVVRQVGKETKFTAPQVASAAKFLAMAGYDIPSIKSAINPVANIALIGDTNLGETADKLTNVMTTFGIAPEKMNDIADIMTSTFTRSNTDMMMLAESAKYAGGIAHMYGGNFQNNFSDVMAMFGILGNAGIQASSAGTTLRMMYQNLMQPNKNQKKTLSHYGITTRDASGSPLEMAEIVKQIYEKVPKEQLADAVGNMFRITAQPGAAALIQAIGTGKLSELIDKNRGAAGTGVAQKIADEKKNTLSGLWAQVESTFTEGILQAVENRQGGWAGVLAQLRDFLAKPETIQILSSLVDMVEQLMKVIKEFAEIYANVYHAFPNLINFWMRFQLFITQIGFLVTPVIQLMGLFDTLKKVMYGVAAATTAAAVAENGRRVATGGGAAATLLGGAVSGAVGRTAQARSSSLLKGLVAAKMTLSNSFSAGRAMGTLSFVPMFSGIKRGALSLLGGLAKAIGLLVSPVGLVTIAIGGLAAIAYKVYKDYKKYKANTKLANENQKRIIQQQKSVSDLYETTGYDVYGIKPLNINLSKPKPKRKDFPSAFSLAKNKIVSNLLNKDNTDKLVGSYIADKYISNFKYLPESYISNYYRDNKNYTYRKKWDRTTGEYVEERHESPAAKENAIKLGIVTQWAALATQQASVKEALSKVQTAIKNKNFNLAQKIVASYKPVSNWSMLTGNDAKAISQIQDPTKYYEWQYAQYKVLQDSLIAETQASKYSHALDLINNFKGSNKKDRENYDGTALAQLLIQSIPVVINGTKASLSLDKMGRIDWAALAKSVNDGIPFTIGQQADIMGNVYEAIYNDPNIKNVSSVIELLQTYLPQIAHVSNPYDGVSWSNWGEDPEGDKQRREKNIEQVVSIPFAAPDITKPSWGLPNSMWDVRKPAVPLLTSDLDRAIAENGGSIVKGTIAYSQKYPNRFPQTSSSASSTTNTNKNNVSRYNPSDDKKQKDYASTYGRNAAKPTQVIINIDKLASFDRTAISKESNERAITEAIEIKIAEAVSMLSSQILTAASATISQGLS